MSEFTKEQIEEYLANGEDKCPFCGSTNDDLNYQDREFDWPRMIQEIICDNCGENWKRIYTITSISK